MRISVVIPTYKRLERLRGCLASMSRQTCPRDQFEVIVIQDGRDWVLPDDILNKDYGIDLRFLTVEHGGCGPARNKGIEQAKYDVIAFVDDDCEASPDWVDQWARYFEGDPNKVAAGGIVNGAPPKTFVEKFICFKQLLHKPSVGADGEFIDLTTANAAFTKSCLLDVGGFTNDYFFAGKAIGTEDVDLTYRVKRRFGNDRLGINYQAVVVHNHRQSLRDLINQHIAYGKGAYVFCIKNDVPYSNLSLMPPTKLGLVRYCFYLLHRIFTKSVKSFKRDHLAFWLYLPYCYLDFVRKFSYMYGFYQMSFLYGKAKRTR
ncbi:MAG: glycosyltransferase [Patescibacteria group bacterium]